MHVEEKKTMGIRYFDGLCGKILVFLAIEDYQHMPTMAGAPSEQVVTPFCYIK